MKLLTRRHHIESLFSEGITCLSKGNEVEAEVCFREACVLRPHFPEALANLALILEQRGDTAEAELIYRRALALSPVRPSILANFGTLLARLGRDDEAETCYRQSLAEQPEAPTTLSNLGVLLACTHREDEAERCYRHALELDGSHRSAQFNLAYLLLKRGCFEEGWERLEARNWYAGYENVLRCPRWKGERIAGKSLLIVCEVGQGDMIQSCRYALELSRAGASRVDVLCHPSLGRLFLTLDGIERVFTLDEQLPSAEDFGSSVWDYWSPPLSLPHFCKTRLETIPAQIPYLKADPVEARSWQTRLPMDGLKMGIVCKGNPRFENDAHRSIRHAKLLRPLLSVGGVSFVSLQKGEGEKEFEQLYEDGPFPGFLMCLRT